MLSRMSHLSRTAYLLARSQNCLKVDPNRPMVITSVQGLGGRDLLSTSSSNIITDLIATSNTAESHLDADRRKMDQKVALIRLKNSYAGRSFRTAKNRNDLVAEFYDLTKAVLTGKLSVDQLVATKTFEGLQTEVDLHIDIMSNAQVVNVLASLIKMKVNPSNRLVKLLEHEIKFRVNSLSVSQIMKLIKFYNACEMSYGQKQLTDILNNGIRSRIHNKKSTVPELVEIMRHLRDQNTKSNLFGHLEDRLLNLLVEDVEHDDDIVAAYIKNIAPYDYKSLCELFIELANNSRRPTPLLKAASNALAKLPMPLESESRPNVSDLITTLNSLVVLSYPYRLLVSKLLDDLVGITELDSLDVTTQCNLLRTIGKLRWRHSGLMDLFFNNLKNNSQDSQKVDHNLIATFIYVAAQLNYKPKTDFREFHKQSMTKEREESFDRSSRKWLNYVWSLALLDLADNSHLESVLNDKYIQGLGRQSDLQRPSHTDVMKLLNLRALAKLDHKIDKLDCGSLDKLNDIDVDRGTNFQKYAAKIREAMNGFVKSNDEMKHDIRTPFGFSIDCALHLNENCQPVPVGIEKLQFDLLRSSLDNPELSREMFEAQRCALIYVLYDETLANTQDEVVGHKKIIKRILDKIGFKTVFLPENLLSREKTSADLTIKIGAIIKSVITEGSVSK